MSLNATLHRLLCCVALCAAFSGAAAPALAAAAKGDFPGPVEAHVLRIIDGDTLVAEATIWPGHVVTATIRLRGIDAPETRAACEEERRTAARAREALSALVGTGPVRISNISAGKYYGRVLADVETADGRGLTGEMLARRLVRPYAGGRRQPWCE
ncbi:thermonuclease family protein [Mesorhizobium xinjiangense]|uniref:thermonuclease family protein n=1 Tax=Mesorhizobium xinjiangense TaxID=2678685 RepID=UPI0012ECF7F1|nr:thermonuclease family protein [Mesorhizobium xinjiangense]